MWERLRRYRALPRNTRLLFLRAVCLLPVISLSLKMRGFGATQRWLENAAPKQASAGGSNMAQGVADVVRAVGAAGRHGFGHPTCLEQSLAIWWLLRRQSVSSQLRIGVRKNAGKFEAHAWVECEGKVLGEPGGEHQHYSAFDAELSRLTEGML